MNFKDFMNELETVTTDAADLVQTKVLKNDSRIFMIVQENENSRKFVVEAPLDDRRFKVVTLAMASVVKAMFGTDIERPFEVTVPFDEKVYHAVAADTMVDVKNETYTKYRQFYLLTPSEYAHLSKSTFKAGALREFVEKMVEYNLDPFTDDRVSVF